MLGLKKPTLNDITKGAVTSRRSCFCPPQTRGRLNKASVLVGSENPVLELEDVNRGLIMLFSDGLMNFYEKLCQLGRS